MNILYLIVAIGVFSGLLSILVVVLIDMLRKRTGTDDAGPMIPKTLVGSIGIGNIYGPGEMLARAGQNEAPRMSLSTVIMTPTRGLRIVSLGGSALILVLLWLPGMESHPGGMTLNLLFTAMLAYAVIFIAGYEARYDDESISAPNWLFQEKTYRWSDFISVKDDGHYLYKLKFDCGGTLHLQKYLVGMPTFLTFLVAVRKINRLA